MQELDLFLPFARQLTGDKYIFSKELSVCLLFCFRFKKQCLLFLVSYVRYIFVTSVKEAYVALRVAPMETH